MYIPKKALLLGQAPLKVSQLFATSLYTGNGGTQTITNGLDLAGKGGLVWAKSRSVGDDHYLFDTSRGAGLALKSNSTQAEENNGRLSAFLSNGFTLNSPSAPNQSGVANVAWTWLEARKFFIKVTYTGNGQAGRQIPHGLGSAVGLLVIKNRSNTGNWQTWSLAANNTTGMAFGRLNTTDAFIGNVGGLNQNGYASANSDTIFLNPGSVDISAINQSGVQYVAYLFAHNPDLIDCGSYVGNGSSSGPSIVCGTGWTPQWILFKNAGSTSSWSIFDTTRGIPNGGGDRLLRPESPNAELSFSWVDLLPNGFKLTTSSTEVNSSGNYIYMAIRSPT